MIPEQLKRDDFRFIKIRPKDKKPYEKGWQKNANYKYDDKIIIDHINNKGNYGVATGFGNLIVIDFDNEEYQDKLLKHLPATFTVQSGGGLCHAYYIIDNAKPMKILDNDKNTILDFQGIGKQVVSAGSIHPNGKAYKVIKDVEITNITLSEIKAIFYNVFPKEWLPKEMKEQVNTTNYQKQNNNDTIWEIKKQYTLIDLLNEQGVNTNQNPTKCPLHSSKGGKSLGFKDDIWHCFHCEEKGDVISLYQLIYGLDFKQALKELCEKLNIEYKPFKQESQRFQKGLSSTVDRLKQIEDFVKENPVYYDKSKIWWLWSYEDNKWEIVDETDILNVIEQELNLRQIIKSKIKNEIIDGLKIIGRRNRPKDPPLNWIQFKNNIYDINTKEKFPPTPDYFFTNPISWNLGVSEETPNIDKLFNEWIPKDLVPQLYEIISYCLYKDYPIHRVFCLIGEGRNGKSKFLELVNRFIGAENRTSTELDVLMDNRFESAKLYKKLICVLSETDYSAMQKTALLKKLSGQDLIGYEFKNKNPFDDYNYAKILIATNGLPITHDKTDGFYRRWLIIDFPNKFPEGKDILATIPKEEYENLALKSVNLLPKLLKNGKFSNELSIEDKRRVYEEKSNPILVFIKERCYDDPNSYIQKYAFNDSFNLWCRDNGYRKFKNTDINIIMREVYQEEKTGPSDKRYWAWIGIKFKESIDDFSKSVQPVQVVQRSELNSTYRKEVQSIGQLGHSGQNLEILLKIWSDSNLIYKTKQLLDMGFSENKLKELKEIGEIFEPKKGEWQCL